MPSKKRDLYYNKAKQMGYRSRASFKLQFINEKFNLIKKGDTVVDLGAAPGGWLQVAKEITEGTVIGVDLQRIEPIEGVFTIKGDMTSPITQAKIFEKVDKVNAVICDAAPNLTGNWGLDHGSWIILVHAFPDASIPVVELSINATKDLDYHFELGKRLAPLRQNGVLLVFSGNIDSRSW